MANSKTKKSVKTRSPAHFSSKAHSHKHLISRSDKRQTVYNIVYRLHELKVKSLELEAGKNDIIGPEFKEILKELEQKGLVYCPKPGVVGCVD